MFEGGKGAGKGEFDSPTGIAVDAKGNILVADTTTGASRNSRQTALFSALWELTESATDN